MCTQQIHITLHIYALWSESSLDAFWLVKDAVYSCRQHRLWSDYADLSLRWVHTCKGTFLHVTAHKVDSLYLSPTDSLKYFEISIPRHIRFAEFRKNKSNNYISQMNIQFDSWSRDILKILWKRGEIAPFPLFHNILMLDFHVKTGTRFSLQDKQLFEIT